MPTYTTPQLRNNLRIALDEAKSGQTVLITRHDETFRLVLEKPLSVEQAKQILKRARL